MKRNAKRLDTFFDYMGCRNQYDQFVIEKSFFLGDSGYFLLNIKAHARFLTNGKSSLEKLQKKGWYRLDNYLEDEYRDKLHAHGFLLFYDKAGLILPHNEKEWLKKWKVPRQVTTRGENFEWNKTLQKVPEKIVNEAVDKVDHWIEEGAAYFGLPDDWNECPLSPQMELEIIPDMPEVEDLPLHNPPPLPDLDSIFVTFDN